MTLELRVRVDRTVATVDAQGEIDVQSAVVLRQGVDRAIGRGATVVLLDLAKVTFIDSSGLAAILSRHRLVSQAGGRLVLVAPTEQTMRLLQVTHLDEVLDVQEDASGIQADPPPPRHRATRGGRHSVGRDFVRRRI